jgi:hypothetical protein
MLQDAVPGIVLKNVPTDVASTDYQLTIPQVGKGYTVRRVTVYDAQGDSSLATLSVRGGAGGTGTTIVADDVLMTHVTSDIVSDRIVAATGITPIVDDPILYVRVGMASGVAGSKVSVIVVIEPLP